MHMTCTFEIICMVAEVVRKFSGPIHIRPPLTSSQVESLALALALVEVLAAQPSPSLLALVVPEIIVANNTGLI